MTLLNRLRGKSDKIPKGHLTGPQWAKKWGLGQSRARDLLKDGLEAGLMKRVRHYVVDSAGSRRPIAHYYEA